MIYNVKIMLRKKKNEENKLAVKFVTIHKTIGAANETQAIQFAREMFDGFLADEIIMETEIIK